VIGGEGSNVPINMFIFPSRASLRVRPILSWSMEERGKEIKRWSREANRLGVSPLARTEIQISNEDSSSPVPKPEPGYPDFVCTSCEP
jgi:hypothetical protein